MTTLAHITSSLRSLGRVPSSTGLRESQNGSNAGTAPAPRKQMRDGLRHKPSIDSRLAAEELALAAHIHSELMSIRLPSVSYARLLGKTIPCRAIGGDFFDAIALNDAICAVVADVSGKGTPAAIVAAMLQGIIHAQMLAHQPLAAIAESVNEFLCSRTTGKFATMVLLKLSAGGTIEYLNCGHIPPVLVTNAGARQLQGSNTVVGLLSGAQYRSQACTLMPGDRMVIFTDGITEAENSRGEQFGDSTFHLNSVDSVLEQLSTFQGSLERTDDWTIFELLYQGRETLQVGSGQLEKA
jgi:phosphoserine phosphatase RsbU/P